MEEASGDSRRVHLHFGQNFSNLKGMDDVRLAGSAHLALVMFYAKLPGFANKSNVFSGSVYLNEAEKCFEAAIDDSLVEDRADRRGGRRRFTGGTAKLCRCGLADGRHASL